MIRNVVNNPFRVLGVYTNAGIKEITAHTGKITAFANVGKSTNFPTDNITPKLLSEISRNQQDVANASAAISLPIDKIKHALFWFINTSPIDDVALNHIKNENYEKAFEIFEKKKCYSSLLNCGVLALIQGDLDTAIENITELIHEDEHKDAFVQTICGDTFKVDADTLSKLFIDELLNSIEASELLDAYRSCGKSSDDDDYLESIVIGKPIALINSEIAKAKNCNDSADANYRAGCALISNTKRALEQLNELCSTDNMQYQTVVDNLARQILQCGINYFNESNDDNAIDNALQLQGYALSIAVSKLLKDRCQENVDILNNQRGSHKIRKELSVLSEWLKKFGSSNKFSGVKGIVNSSTSLILEIDNFIEGCNKELQTISNKMGVNNKYYIDYSDMVAKIALNKLIEIVNEAQSFSSLSLFSEDELNRVVSDAIITMGGIGRMQLKPETRSYFNTNKQTLNEIYKRLNPSFSDKYAGCLGPLIFLLIPIIIFIISDLCSNM